MGRRWKARTRRRSASKPTTNGTATGRRAGLDGTDHALEQEQVIDPEREHESGPRLETDRELDHSEESEHDRLQEENLEPAQVTLDYDLDI